ncbi:MAG: M48 family metallopeptidase, partial [Parcubacteria group bacterium]|nr:M48 family metallopeptidase [Parcubacteria group bacterium]
IIGVGWVFSQYYGSPSILLFAVIFSSVMAILSYWYSDKIVLAIAGAREVAKKSDYPALYRIVENLAIAAGLPMPRIYIIEEQAPNAFATGRNPEHAVVAVTGGLLERLNKNELEGVIAHELSHIGNRDMLLSTVVVVLVGFISLISDWFMRSLWWGGRDRDDNRGSGVLMILALVAAILAPLIAMLMQLAISRRREFLADASGALLTRYPDGLASALEKISSDPTPMRHARPATAHLYFENPFKGDSPRGRARTACGGKS